MDELLASWIVRTAQRDEAAFKSLYDCCSPKLYGVALKVLRNPASAEEVIQEAFLQVWLTAGTFRNDLGPAWPWMVLIVRSRALDHMRRRRAQRISNDECLMDELQSPNPGPLQTAESEQLASTVDRQLQRMAPRARQILTWTFVHDLSHSEVAAKMAMPLGSVKSVIRRGIGELKAAMRAV